jgi:hypothetical protein
MTPPTLSLRTGLMPRRLRTQKPSRFVLLSSDRPFYHRVFPLHQPEDWDEEAPYEIIDTEATKPEGWLDDEPLTIPDPGETYSRFALAVSSHTSQSFRL